MATVNLIPRDIIGGETLAYNNWTKTSGAAYVNIDDPVGSPDDATTVITVNTITSPQSKQSFYVDDWALGTATITAVNAKVRMKSQFGSGKFRVIARNSAGTEGAAPTETTLTTSFADYTIDLTGLRPGGGSSWVTGDFASFQLVVYKSTGGSNTITVTQVYLEITYTVSSTALTADQAAFGSGFGFILGVQPAYARAWASQLGLQAAYAYSMYTIPGLQAGYARGVGNIPGNQASYASAWATVSGLQAAYASGSVSLQSTPQAGYATGVGNILGSQAAWAQGPLTVAVVGTPQAAYATGVGNIAGLQQGYARAYVPIAGNQEAFARSWAPIVGAQAAYAFVMVTRTGFRDAYATGAALLPAFQNAYATGSTSAFVTFTGLQAAFATGIAFSLGLQQAYVRAAGNIRGAQAAYAMPLAITLGTQDAYARASAILRGAQNAWARGPYQINGSQAAYARGIGSSRIIYAVTAIEGPSEGSWAKLFDRIAKRGESFVIRENIGDNQILVTLEQFSETHTRSESVAETVYACPIPDTTLFPQATGLYPC